MLYTVIALALFMAVLRATMAINAEEGEKKAEDTTEPPKAPKKPRKYVTVKSYRRLAA